MNRKATEIRRPVGAAALGAALATLIFWAVPGVEPQAVVLAGTTLLTFLCGYVVND